MGSDKINNDVKNPNLSWDTLTQAQRSEIDSLLAKGFPVEPGHSFFEDFPVWDPEHKVSHRDQILGRNPEGELVCSASIRVAELSLGQGQSTRVALVGAVVSDPDHRGQGYASAAIQRILDSSILSDSKISCVVLWGSEKNLYARFDFDYGGAQKRTSLGLLHLPEFLPDPSLDVQLGWSDEVFTLMQRRDSGLLHRSSDLNWLKSHKNVVWFRIIREGKTTAYVGINRGIDLMGIVHEWGGSELDLGILLSAIRVENPNLQIIYHPEHEKNYAFFRQTTEFEMDRLCMVKWLKEKDQKILDRLWFFGLDSG